MSNGSDECILNSSQVIKWRITHFFLPFDQASPCKVFRSRLTQSIQRFLGLPAGVFPGKEAWPVDFSAWSFSLRCRDHTIVAATALIDG